MDIEAIKRRMTQDGRIRQRVEVSLGQLIDWDIEALNDFADEQILGDGYGLCDIHYQVVGFKPEKTGHWAQGIVVIEVDANISEFLTEYEED